MYPHSNHSLASDRRAGTSRLASGARVTGMERRWAFCGRIPADGPWGSNSIEHDAGAGDGMGSP